MRRAIPSLTAAALALAACAPAAPPPEPAAHQTVATATATVVGVDPAARTIRLRDASTGAAYTVPAPAPPEALARIRPGDTIMLDVFSSLALEAAPPDDVGAAETVAGRAPAPAGPGGVSVGSTSLVVDFLGYDAAAGTVTVRGPDGTTRRLAVPGPLGAFAARLAPGDRVLVRQTEAVALSVTPP